AVIIGNGLGGQQIRAEYVLLIMHRLLERTIETLPSFGTLPVQCRNRLLSDLRGTWCPQFTPISSNSLVGVLGNIIAARIAHYYNFRPYPHGRCCVRIHADRSGLRRVRAQGKTLRSRVGGGSRFCDGSDRVHRILADAGTLRFGKFPVRRASEWLRNG